MASPIKPIPLRIFFDSSVVIAGAFSKKGASYILLQLSNLTLLEGRISNEVRVETERNVLAKVPAALPALRVLLAEALTEGPRVTEEAMNLARPYADPKDIPILAAALAQECHYLVTLNGRDFWPPATMIDVITPGDLLKEIRLRLYQE